MATISVTAGNTAVVFCSTTSTGNTNANITASDTNGDTFTAAGVSYTDTGTKTENKFFIVKFGTTNASEAISCAYVNTANDQNIAVLQFSGVATSPLDLGPVNATNTATTSFVTGTTGTTSQAAEVAVAGFVEGGTASPVTWTGTNSYICPTNGAFNSGVNTSGCLTYKILSAQGTQQGTVTAGSAVSGAGMIITLKATGGVAFIPQIGAFLPGP